MTERKGLVPEITPETHNQTTARIRADINECLQEKITFFNQRGDHLYKFFRELEADKNYQGLGFALVIYEMLEKESYKKNLKPLPLITESIADLVEDEVKKMGKDYFFNDAHKRWREDNKLVAGTVDKTLINVKDIQEIIPTAKMYRMLEIAEEEERIAKLANRKLEEN